MKKMIKGMLSVLMAVTLSLPFASYAETAPAEPGLAAETSGAAGSGTAAAVPGEPGFAAETTAAEPGTAAETTAAAEPGLSTETSADGQTGLAAVSAEEALASVQRIAGVHGMTITYQLPDGQTETLDGSTLASWVTGSQGATVTVDQEKAAAYVQGLKDKYDTHGTQTWKSADGTTKSIKTGFYSWSIDKEKETAALIEAIQGLQSVTREPVYASRGTQYAMPQWGTSFVEIDLSSQHAYYYQNGSCVWDSQVVTGTATDPERATPTGVFKLNYKQKDRVLKGQIDPKTKKPSYESHVDYWMPFNGGIGLHDASWRSSFGGTIYKKNGSHGCINLPKAKAKALYELISKGTVIVVCE